MSPTHYTHAVPEQDMLTHTQKSSFHAGYQLVELPAGFELWRFVSQGHLNYFSDFWIDPVTMSGIMRRLHDNNRFDMSYKKENVRDSLAILGNWSELNYRVKIRLCTTMLAYVGQTGSQKMFQANERPFPRRWGEKVEKAVETRIGRHKQYVIPRFKHITNYKDWATIEYFAHI